MQRLFIILFTILLWVGGYAEIGKLGPRLGRIALYPEKARFVEPGLLKKSGGRESIRVIVTFDGDLDDLRRAGASVICARDNIAVVAVPLSQLKTLSSLPSVVYVEAPLPATAQLDASTQLIQAVKARTLRGVTGRNVIVGIIDSGIDYTHHDFRKADGSTRIKYLLDLSASGPVYGGVVYTEEDINNALNGVGVVDEIDASGHGSHVAGIAAGDGSDGDGYGVYAGVAPEADLVIVKATRDDQGREFLTVDQILALTFIDSVAALLGKPYVANLSLGGHNGAHDGTSSTERFIDNLVGPGKPGKVVITVAGNDGEADVHARVAVNSSSNSVISFNINAYQPQGGAGNDMVVLDGWYDGAVKIGVKLTSPSGKSYGPVQPGNVLDRTTDEGTIYIWNGFYDSGNGYQPGANPLNGDREFYIQISDEDSQKWPSPGEWTVELSGSGGTVDAWIATATMDASFLQGKVDDGKLAIPGTARNSITAAAYISKKNWYDLDGNHLTFDSNGEYDKGDIAGFSSPGPVRTSSYQKPEIAAPVQIIVSTYSEQAPPSNPYSIFAQTDPRYPNALINQDGDHALNSGTSMAAPHVAGAAALILELFPDLTAVQVREMLINAADTDSYVGQTPNNAWGWGKLNVFKALQIIPGEETPAKLMLHVPAPNPFLNQTRIDFDLPIVRNVGNIKIAVYNAIGQHVRTLVDEQKNIGSHTVYWDGRDSFGSPVGGGVYFVQMKFDNSEIVKKVVFLGRNK